MTISHSAIDCPAPDCRVTAYTQLSAIGHGVEALRQALNDRRSGLRPNDYPGSAVDTWIGRVAAADREADLDWTAQEQWRSRNNALVRLGLAADGFFDRVIECRERFGPGRMGVVIGTSTSSIGRTEEAYAAGGETAFPGAYRQPWVHNPHSPGAYVAHLTGIEGLQMTISTACASSARVFATGWRWLQAGLVDAVLVGGIDSLCHSVLAGFQSLELTSPRPCQPFDARRSGINLGEAAGYAILMRATDAPPDAPRLAGYGESSDAYHMSQPPPGGEGAQRSMRDALRRAGITGADIDYVNLHGTASQANDQAESEALAALLPADVFVSSTKGWTGHTLGAAGILEAVITLEALHNGHLPGTLNLEEPDPGLAFPVARENGYKQVRHAMSNSFGFGGNNCSLVFSKESA